MSRPHIVIITLIVAASAFLTGCLRTMTTVILKSDGTAVVRDSILFSMKGSTTEDRPDFRSDSVRKMIDSAVTMSTRMLGPDAKLANLRMIEQPEYQGWVAEYAIANVNTLRVDQSRLAKMLGTDEAGSMEEEGNTGSMGGMTFSYAKDKVVITNVADLKSDTKEKKGKKQTKEQLDMALDMMESFLRDMRMTINVQSEPAIRKTNAKHVTGSTITMYDVDMDKLLAAFRKNRNLMNELEGFESMGPSGFEKVLRKLPNQAVIIELQPTVTIQW